MAKYKAYPEYKDSGVEWLGEIPGHWDVFTGKRIFQSVRTPALKNDEQLAASQKFGVIPQSLMMQLNDSKVMLALKGTDSFRHVDENNFVISLRSFEGGIEHSKYSGCVSPAYTVLKNTKPLSYSYYRYLLKCAPFIAALQSSTDSLRDGKSINYEQFGAICLPITSVFEQNLIAAFLDHETAKIDNLIEKQQQLIELLKEKRQAVISHAVTKGLNPDVPMKDSGIEWLGEVPEHWEVCLLKFKCDSITDGAHISPDTNGGLHYFISIKDIKKGEINFDNALLTTAKSYEYLIKAGCMPLPGDILFSKDGTIGQTAITPSNVDFVVASSLIIIRPNKTKILSEFLDFLLQSSLVKEQVESFVKGAALRRLSIQNLHKTFGVFPPLEEQIRVSNYIKNKLYTFDVLETKAASQISLLQERRTALISAAVTGKIDVRDWVAPNACEAEVSQEATA
ncbi:restriction endonuclease subunit S [Hafnia paralvei]